MSPRLNDLQMSPLTQNDLSGELSFATVQATLDRQAADGATTVDLTGVTRTDSAGLALLLEWTRAAQTRGGLRFENTPPQLRKLAEFFGLSDLLALH